MRYGHPGRQAWLLGKGGDFWRTWAEVPHEHRNCEAAQSSVQTIYKWGLNSFRWGSTEQEHMAPQNRTERNHNRMLGHSQKPKSKNSGNKETQNGQSLDDSKSENQSSILTHTHFKRHKANTAFLSDRVQSTNQLTDMCKVINLSPFAGQN